MRSTWAALGARGAKAPGGRRKPVATSNCPAQRRRPGAPGLLQRRAAYGGTTRSAETSLLPCARSRRMIEVTAAKGGLETTRNGLNGSRRSLASACTTLTWAAANLLRRWRQRLGCSSTATTRAPLSTSQRVSSPRPAPMSSTRSPGATAASSTSRIAQPLSSSCHPHRGALPPGTEDHDHDRHWARLAPQAAGGKGFSRGGQDLDGLRTGSRTYLRGWRPST